jgi:hypothetical protein
MEIWISQTTEWCGVIEAVSPGLCSVARNGIVVRYGIGDRCRRRGDGGTVNSAAGGSSVADRLFVTRLIIQCSSLVHPVTELTTRIPDYGFIWRKMASES